jgi:hypothetical protein
MDKNNYYFDFLVDDIINILFYYLKHESRNLAPLKIRYGKLYGIYKNNILTGKINPSLYFRNMPYNKETLFCVAKS